MCSCIMKQTLVYGFFLAEKNALECSLAIILSLVNGKIGNKHLCATSTTDR